MGKIFVVATPIGNLNDISKRALDTLKEVDLILCEDTRHSIKLLNHYDIKNKLISYHKFNEKERSKEIIEKIIKDNLNIAVISDAGTPSISDPGYIIVEEAIKHNIEIIGVGGISAITTALSISGFNLNNFSFYGFFPKETKEKKEIIKNIKNNNIEVSVFYESPKRIIKTLEYIKQELGNINISVSSDLTKLHEKTYYGTIEKVIKDLKDNPKAELGEYAFIIKTKKELEKKDEISIESKLIDIMIKNKVTQKEAIDILNKKEDNISKKDIYNASLNLKDILNN